MTSIANSVSRHGTEDGAARPLAGQRSAKDGVAHAVEPALPASADRMPERRRHRASGGQDGRSERPGEAAWATPSGTT